jgi:hypothetical protein
MARNPLYLVQTLNQTWLAKKAGLSPARPQME